MLVRQILAALTGLSAGVIAAGGLVSFIIGLGVLSDLADRTHTADCILYYEDAVTLGGVLANVFWIYQIHIPGGIWIVPVFALFGGIFVGCWAMALAEMLNIFPVFLRRLQIGRYVSQLIVGIALGKGLGALLFFVERW